MKVILVQVVYCYKKMTMVWITQFFVVVFFFFFFFLFKKFNKHQKNYSTVEKECLSLILALQHFEVYLTSSSSPVVVFSNCNPLIFIHKMKNKNQRLVRWCLLSQEYKLDVMHIRGKNNIIPDALSRA